MIITGKQIAVARTLLDASQKDFAEIGGTAVSSISSFESGKSNLNAASLNAIIEHIISKGVEFIPGNSARFKEGIRYYRGADEFRLLFDDIYNTARTEGGDILIYNGIPDALIKWLGEDFYAMHSKRMSDIKDNFNFKIAIKKGDNNFIASDFAEYRWIKKQSYVPQMKYIYGNNLCWMDFSGNVRVTVIESADITEAERTIFFDLWEGLDKTDGNI